MGALSHLLLGHWRRLVPGGAKPPTAAIGRRTRVARGARIPAGAMTGLLIAAVAVGPSAFALPAAGQEPPITEYQLKTAFLYNFAKFVDWPADAFPGTGAGFRLCVLGEEPFLTARASLAGKSIRGRPVEVARVGAAEEARACHMLFVGAADSERAAPVLAGLGRNVLTVGESADFTQHGGLINLVRIDNKIRFEIDRTAGERSGLKFSAQLLKLAILVEHGR